MSSYFLAILIPNLADLSPYAFDVFLGEVIFEVKIFKKKDLKYLFFGSVPLRSMGQICKCQPFFYYSKVEKILKGSLDSIPSPSPLVKIQIMGGKFS